MTSENDANLLPFAAGVKPRAGGGRKVWREPFTRAAPPTPRHFCRNHEAAFFRAFVSRQTAINPSVTAADSQPR
jgi:hypothetical protein